jgi:cytochrome c oxidase cbb3-type subunit III
MNLLRSALPWSALLSVSLLVSFAQTTTKTPSNVPSGVGPRHDAGGNSYPPAQVKAGQDLFEQNCAFCHGRDAMGGETGPDLTRSKLVGQDVNGDKIGAVVSNGRPDQGMPRFDFADPQIASLAAFIHTQRNNAMGKKGGRKGVDVSDLQTGNVAAGKAYFDGPGGCSTCHSPTGDLAGVATRYQGLALEERMLYPKNAKSKVTVTLPSGQTVTGTLAYKDEFTVGMIGPTGAYQSWRMSDVKVKIDSPVDAHVALFSKYTDDDIHNLMAYLQTLR